MLFTHVNTEFFFYRKTVTEFGNLKSGKHLPKFT